MKIERMLPIAIVFLANGPANAGDCDTLVAAHGESVYHCMLVANDGTSTKSADSCFLDLDEGFTWLSKQGALVKGQFLRADCRNSEGRVRYRDWAKAKGLTVDPNFREPRSATSPAAESAAAQRDE